VLRRLLPLLAALLLSACAPVRPAARPVAECSPLPEPATGLLRIDFLDVGQGDAALVTSPTGKTVLIDGGPPDAADALVARLSRLGRPLDLILLSHRHLDHLGGLPRVVREVGTRMFLDAPFPHPSPAYARLLDALAERGVEVKDASRGRAIDLGGGATLTLLGPPEPPLSRTRSDVNANSVVARLQFGATSVLFLGDAEADTERWLLDEQADRLPSRVIKVAHHGSRHSSTVRFVDAVKAEIAVVSASARNSYGHPAAETLERWERAGARVYRTDRDGDVTVTTDGEGVTVTTARHPGACRTSRLEARG